MLSWGGVDFKGPSEEEDEHTLTHTGGVLIKPLVVLSGRFGLIRVNVHINHR